MKMSSVEGRVCSAPVNCDLTDSSPLCTWALHLRLVLESDLCSGDFNPTCVSEVCQRYESAISSAPPFSEPDLHRSLAVWHTVELPRNRTIDNFRGDRLLGSIHADVIRTGKYLFLHLAPETMDESGPLNFPPIYQHVFRRLERILYVFATRSRCGYLQGFNEIAAILFRVCTNHFRPSRTGTPDDSQLNDALTKAEAFAHAIFERVMIDGGQEALFADMSAQGSVTREMDDFQAILRRHLPEQAAILERHGITPIYYAMRWLTLLFSHEYELASLQFLWKEMFRHFEHFREYVKYVAVAHVWAVGKEFRPDNYPKTLDAIQHIPNAVKTNLPKIVRCADLLFERDGSGKKRRK
jgi:hypothetical protein